MGLEDGNSNNLSGTIKNVSIKRNKNTIKALFSITGMYYFTPSNDIRFLSLYFLLKTNIKNARMVMPRSVGIFLMLSGKK
ncbi:MAG: hypothetical protein SCALA702_17350 [Melioribacteraceae bacterium]|nr:MAG: hypothetical protein SCALA702_17350 [Melioribacteraceae bacterium]